MSTTRTRTSDIRIRMTERVHLFLANSPRSNFVKKTIKASFEFYSHKLLRPYFQYQLSKRSHPLKYLFVLSPMRSGSSLLVHLLNSNSEIEGFGESHCAYSNCQDLEHLIYRTAVIQNSFDFKNASYVMDKIVRNHDISEEILKDKNTKFIFLLRDPEASFKSVAQLGKNYPLLQEYNYFDHWFEYYQERLNFLQKTAQTIDDKHRCLFIQYEALLYQTEVSLQRFQSFLDTKTAFFEEYKVSKTTGSLRYGDPSNVLKSGKILRPQNTHKEHTHIFNQEEKELVYRTYQNCIDHLIEVAETC